MAALIASNRGHCERQSSYDSNSDATEGSDDSNAPYVPSPVKRQTKLSNRRLAMTSSSQPGVHDSSKTATLVVCPMSLLSQWQVEIERSIGSNNTNVILYYGAGRGDLEDDLEADGIGVVITRFVRFGYKKISNAESAMARSQANIRNCQGMTASFASRIELVSLQSTGTGSSWTKRTRSSLESPTMRKLAMP